MRHRYYSVTIPEDVVRQRSDVNFWEGFGQQRLFIRTWFFANHRERLILFICAFSERGRAPSRTSRLWPISPLQPPKDERGVCRFEEESWNSITYNLLSTIVARDFVTEINGRGHLYNEYSHWNSNRRLGRHGHAPEEKGRKKTVNL